MCQSSVRIPSVLRGPFRPADLFVPDVAYEWNSFGFILRVSMRFCSYLTWTRMVTEMIWSLIWWKRSSWTPAWWDCLPCTLRSCLYLSQALDRWRLIFFGTDLCHGGNGLGGLLEGIYRSPRKCSTEVVHSLFSSGFRWLSSRSQSSLMQSITCTLVQ